jgi:hypothetical protein
MLVEFPRLDLQAPPDGGDSQRYVQSTALNSSFNSPDIGTA